MTEAEWVGSTDPSPMVGFVRKKATDRKFRLLAVAACRRVWELLEDERSRKGVEIAELHADGQVDDHQLDAALTQANDASEDATYREDPREIFVPRCDLAKAVVSATQPPSDRSVAYEGWEALAMISHALAILRPDSAVERVPFFEGYMTFESGVIFKEKLSLDEQIAQSGLIRDIFGNPFRKRTAKSAWLSETVISLAESIYTNRAFDRLPILADALEEAGCTDAAILAHCRGPGPHVRGCWVVDLLLGKM